MHLNSQCKKIIATFLLKTYSTSIELLPHFLEYKQTCTLLLLLRKHGSKKAMYRRGNREITLQRINYMCRMRLSETGLSFSLHAMSSVQILERIYMKTCILKKTLLPFRFVHFPSASLRSFPAASCQSAFLPRKQPIQSEQASRGTIVAVARTCAGLIFQPDPLSPEKPHRKPDSLLLHIFISISSEIRGSQSSVDYKDAADDSNTQTSLVARP